MKVLFISSSSGSRGGGELYLLFLGEALIHHGIEVGLLCSSHRRMDELAEAFSVIGKVFRADYKNTYDYKIRSLRNLFSNPVKTIGASIESFKPDVIHLNKQNIEDGLDLLETLDRLNIPYVTTIHITQTQESLGALLGAFRDSVSRVRLRRSKTRKWIAISPNRARDLCNFLPDQKEDIVMIPNGVKLAQNSSVEKRVSMREKFNVPQDNLVIISVGRLEGQKDPLKFIDWAEKLLRSNGNLTFYWIGDGTLRNEVERKIDGLGLSDHIVCLGWQKDVVRFYTMADIYLHTAQFEGLPFSLLEAMSWKLPCAVSDELYKDLLFPEGIVYKGLEGFVSLVSDHTLRENVGLSAYHFVQKNYSMDVISQSYRSLYDSIS